MNLKRTGVGTRAMNFAVDTVLVTILAIAFYNIYKWYVYYYRIAYFNFGWFFFGTQFIYYTILESIFGRTPGKWFSHSKVVNQRGFRPALGSIIVRSLARIIIIDMFFIPFLDKTLHDYISKTEVVEA